MLDDPHAVLMHLREMAHAGAQAHHAAAEDDDRNGAVRDLIFGINTIIDALVMQIEEAL